MNLTKHQVENNQSQIERENHFGDYFDQSDQKSSPLSHSKDNLGGFEEEMENSRASMVGVDAHSQFVENRISGVVLLEEDQFAKNSLDGRVVRGSMPIGDGTEQTGPEFSCKILHLDKKLEDHLEQSERVNRIKDMVLDGDENAVGLKSHAQNVSTVPLANEFFDSLICEQFDNDSSIGKIQNENSNENRKNTNNNDQKNQIWKSEIPINVSADDAFKERASFQTEQHQSLPANHFELECRDSILEEKKGTVSREMIFEDQKDNKIIDDHHVMNPIDSANEIIEVKRVSESKKQIQFREEDLENEKNKIIELQSNQKCSFKSSENHKKHAQLANRNLFMLIGNEISKGLKKQSCEHNVSDENNLERMILEDEKKRNARFSNSNFTKMNSEIDELDNQVDLELRKKQNSINFINENRINAESESKDWSGPIDENIVLSFAEKEQHGNQMIDFIEDKNGKNESNLGENFKKNTSGIHGIMFDDDKPFDLNDSLGVKTEKKLSDNSNFAQKDNFLRKRDEKLSSQSVSLAQSFSPEQSNNAPVLSLQESGHETNDENKSKNESFLFKTGKFPNESCFSENLTKYDLISTNGVSENHSLTRKEEQMKEIPQEKESLFVQNRFSDNLNDQTHFYEENGQSKNTQLQLEKNGDDYNRLKLNRNQTDCNQNHQNTEKDSIFQKPVDSVQRMQRESSTKNIDCEYPVCLDENTIGFSQLKIDQNNLFNNSNHQVINNSELKCESNSNKNLKTLFYDQTNFKNNFSDNVPSSNIQITPQENEPLKLKPNLIKVQTQFDSENKLLSEQKQQSNFNKTSFSNDSDSLVTLNKLLLSENENEKSLIQGNGNSKMMNCFNNNEVSDFSFAEKTEIYNMEDLIENKNEFSHQENKLSNTPSTIKSVNVQKESKNSCFFENKFENQFKQNRNEHDFDKPENDAKNNSRFLLYSKLNTPLVVKNQSIFKQPEQIEIKINQNLISPDMCESKKIKNPHSNFFDDVDLHQNSNLKRDTFGKINSFAMQTQLKGNSQTPNCTLERQINKNKVISFKNEDSFAFPKGNSIIKKQQTEFFQPQVIRKHSENPTESLHLYKQSIQTTKQLPLFQTQTDSSIKKCPVIAQPEMMYPTKQLNPVSVGYDQCPNNVKLQNRVVVKSVRSSSSIDTKLSQMPKNCITISKTPLPNQPPSHVNSLNHQTLHAPCLYPSRFVYQSETVTKMQTHSKESPFFQSPLIKPFHTVNHSQVFHIQSKLTSK